MNNTSLLIGLIIIALIASIFLGSPLKQQKQAPLATNIGLGSLPPLGEPEAPIKIVEFADFLCPYCALAITELYPNLEPLINQGKVAIYFRDFVVHPESLIIHSAARCANEENKFWEFNKEVFKEFLNKKETYKEEVLIELAKNLGLNVENFEKCVKANKYTKEIQNDFEEAVKLGVQGTPTFFINGEKVEGLDIKGVLTKINSLLK